MSKIKIGKFVLFFLLSNSLNLYGSENFCVNKNGISNQPHSLNKKLDLIEISINNSRKWYVNSRKLILDIQRQDYSFTEDGYGKIKDRYKKRFGAKLKINFTDGSVCRYEADVRQHGDMMDHISLVDGSLFQSMSVNLKNGNINGITKFILFLPETRNAFDEIFFTELLRNLDYLAPRTRIIKVKTNNNVDIQMLFQEKSTKELLEFNQKREGPLLEGDESFRKLFYEMKNNFLIAKNELSKQTNTKWAKKNTVYKDISVFALTHLNLFYLSNNFLKPVNKKKINFPVINIDNNLLSLGDVKQNEKLDKYNILMIAANGLHGLINNNRKFYWNSLYNFFEPVYYDGDLNINKLNLGNYNIHSFPSVENINLYIDDIKQDVDNIDFDNFYKNLKKLNLDVNKKFVLLKKKQIIDNLNYYKKNYLILSNNVSLEKMQNQKILGKIFLDRNQILNDKNLFNHYLVFKNLKNESFYGCGSVPFQCNILDINQEEEINLLNGKLIVGNFFYEYVGAYNDINDNNFENFENFENFVFQEIKNNLNKVTISNSVLFFTDNMEVDFNKDKSIINIKQNRNDARAFFLGGELKGMKINYFGSALPTNLSYKNHPYGIKGLTGCISFVDINFTNVSINSSNSNCEDSINIINSNGHIEKVEINNSFFDALDIDFSKIKINEILIKNAGNDCIDLSFGNYDLKLLTLDRCNDKALSAGEKSFVKIDNASILNSNTGIASKDSSITNIKNVSIKNVKTCLAAYNKKQEFFGGSIAVENIACKNYLSKVNVDNYSKINIENTVK